MLSGQGRLKYGYRLQHFENSAVEVAKQVLYKNSPIVHEKLGRWLVAWGLAWKEVIHEGDQGLHVSKDGLAENVITCIME